MEGELDTGGMECGKVEGECDEAAISAVSGHEMEVVHDRGLYSLQMRYPLAAGEDGMEVARSSCVRVGRASVQSVVVPMGRRACVRACGIIIVTVHTLRHVCCCRRSCLCRRSCMLAARTVCRRCPHR